VLISSLIERLRRILRLKGRLCLLLLPLLPTSGLAAELPAPLRERLHATATLERPARERLMQAALAIQEAGWAADSLELLGETLQVHGARPDPLRLLETRGEVEQPSPWEIGDTLAAPAPLLTGAEEWLAAMDRCGFPFAQVWLRPARNEGELGLTLLLSGGPSGPLGELRVSGGKRLAESFLTELIDLPEGRPLSRDLARRGRDRLLATGWFLQVADPELGWDPVAERVGLLYRVEERPRPNRIMAFLGGGGGETSGALDLDFFSPFGQGRRWRLGADWQGQQRSRLEMLFSEPRLLGRGLALDLSLGRAKQDSTWLRQEVEVDLRLPLPAGWQGIVGVGYERSLFNLNADEGEGAETSRRRHRFGLAWRSLAGDPGRPRNLRLQGDLLIKRSSLEGEAPDERQLAVDLAGRWTWRLARPWKLRLRGGGQGLWAASGGFNLAELYPLGGALTLRGYDEEFFRGDRVAHFTSELALGEPLELSLFLDYGWGRWRRPDGPESRFEGWGAGIGLLAPGEHGRFSLALALGESRRMEDIRVHLAVDTGF
jgi:hypothetical protein